MMTTANSSTKRKLTEGEYFPYPLTPCSNIIGLRSVRWPWEPHQRQPESLRAAWTQEGATRWISWQQGRQNQLVTSTTDKRVTMGHSQPPNRLSPRSWRARSAPIKSSSASQMDSKEFSPTTRLIANWSFPSSVTVDTAEETDPRTILERVSGTQQFKANNSRGSSVRILSQSEPRHWKYSDAVITFLSSRS